MNDLLNQTLPLEYTKGSYSILRKTESNRIDVDSFNAMLEEEKNNRDVYRITAKDIDRAKEVGLQKFQEIQKIRKAIMRASRKAIDEFPSYSQTIGNMFISFRENIPKSVHEALDRLYDFLKNLPDDIKAAILQDIEDETGLKLNLLKKEQTDNQKIVAKS